MSEPAFKVNEFGDVTWTRVITPAHKVATVRSRFTAPTKHKVTPNSNPVDYGWGFSKTANGWFLGRMVAVHTYSEHYASKEVESLSFQKFALNAWRQVVPSFHTTRFVRSKSDIPKDDYIFE